MNHLQDSFVFLNFQYNFCFLFQYFLKVELVFLLILKNIFLEDFLILNENLYLIFNLYLFLHLYESHILLFFSNFHLYFYPQSPLNLLILKLANFKTV